MIRSACLGILASLALSPAFAAQGPACTSRGLDYLALSAAELAQVAAECTDPALRTLYRRRAEHSQIASTLRILGRLQMEPGARYNSDPKAIRLHMALVEAMAQRWYPDDAERVVFLNGEYQRRIRIAELRLRGDELAAARLEREYTVRD